MKHRLSQWLLWREERWLWIPRRALRWAFDYAMEHGEPARFEPLPLTTLITITSSSAWLRPDVNTTSTLGSATTIHYTGGTS